ncbi:MAG: sugar ABC transporter substrate-binding protein, partial [Calditrichia bacterium]
MTKTARQSFLIKFLILNIFALLLTTGVFSCRNEKSGSTNITFWAMGAEGETVQKLLPEFYQTHPGIRVEVQMIPWTAAQEKLITAYASNNSPDLFQLGNTWIPQFAALHAIENLDHRVNTSAVINRDNYFPGIWETNRIDSNLYGIPWYVDTRVLFYRTDVLREAGFDHPPRTWRELYQAAKKIKASAGPDQYAIYMPTNEWAPYIIFGMQQGSRLLRDHNQYGNFSSPDFRKAFEYLIRFHKEGLAPMGVSQVTNVYQAFADKYFVMYISGPWNVKEFRRWMTGDLADKWSTAPLPAPNDSTPALSLAGGASLVISRNSENKEAAWQLIEYLSRTDVQLKFYHLLSDLPAVKSAWQDSSLKNNRYMQAFYRQFQNVIATPKIPEWDQIAFSKVQQYAELAARGAL